MKILIAGGAGFIGSALASRLASEGHEVVGIDNLSCYYDPSLKRERLVRDGFTHDLIDSLLSSERGVFVTNPRRANHSFAVHDICDEEATYRLLDIVRPDAVVNLAAQPGVRFSRGNPRVSVRTNIVGFFNLIDASREAGVSHFLYASSSSVYGNNVSTPFREVDECHEPLSVYAATKLCDESLAGAYSRAYGMRTTGVRMFSVYGPWGRPDMAPFIFAKALTDGENIELYGGGLQTRDFTYIDDVVESLSRLLFIPGGNGEHEIYNVGSGRPIPVRELLSLIQRELCMTGKITEVPEQPGEARRTFADSRKLRGATGYQPATPLEEGVARFVAWFRLYRPTH